MRSTPVKPQLFVQNEIQRRRDMLVRTLPISILPAIVGLITALLIHILMGGEITPHSTWYHSSVALIALCATAILFTLLILIARLGRPTISVLLFMTGWTLITTLTALHNSVTSYWPALLIVPICAAGLLLDGVASVMLAILDSLVISAFGFLESSSVLSLHPLYAGGFWIAVFWSVAALTWLLAGSLQRTLEQSRRQAQVLLNLSTGLESCVAAQTDELATRAERAEALYEVSRALTNTLDLSEVLALITEQAARLLHFESTLVLLEQPGQDPLGDVGFRLMGAYHPPAILSEILTSAEALLQQVLREQRAQVATLALPSHAQPERPVSTLVLPMSYGDNLRGVLVLLNSARPASREKDDLALAEGLADQAAVAIANAQMVARLRESAMLEERTRLAREIHDTLAQGLTGIVVQLSAAEQARIDAPDEMPEHLDLAQRMAREALAEARRSVWNLRAPALERGELADALLSLATRTICGETPGIFERRGDPWPLTPSIESALLRVCQEALANVAKHAQASVVRVVLEYTDSAVLLHIIDNGIGFDAAAVLRPPIAPGPWGGFGLLGMRERLTTLGGRLDITIDHGTWIRAMAPRPLYADQDHDQLFSPYAYNGVSALFDVLLS